ncbi:MAG TPA: LuxR C-terminal-related transcriptional regulator [Ideonella sp.]|uniref:helix-turn-helix transcriptional regulator n=1 Tax=Ideonella sp. TaxID=1929293 RepID=UPI002BFD2944|nr:LuxR C-terminal-related transcriptional regulator [Ideonella sp.]HSI47453.1 LuxR C-terminal-related transcriptional regulator [Ideonella sp.]
MNSLRPPLSSQLEFGDAFLRGMEAAHAIGSPQQFFVWLRLHIHRFVPHELALCRMDGGRGLRRARMLNCVPLPEALKLSLADPEAPLWRRLLELWERGDERALQIPLAQLEAPGNRREGDTTHPLFAGLGEAGFRSLRVHALHTGLSRGGPELLFAFVSQQPASEACMADALTALELWVPYLHFAWLRAEGGAQLASRRQPVGEGSALSARELQVLSAVRDSHANAQIGELLGISPLTVKNHLRSIQRKLGARNRAHAVAEAMARRLIA